MSKKILFLILILIPTFIRAQGVAINTDGSEAHSSAILDVSSTNAGILIPRLTQAQRDAISGPATGLIIFQTDNTPGFYYNAGTSVSPSWIKLSVPTDNFDDNDADATNEFQTLSISGHDLTLSNGGGTVTIPDNVNDADANSSNEIQSLGFSNPNLSISGSNSVNLSGLKDNLGNHSATQNLDMNNYDITDGDNLYIDDIYSGGEEDAVELQNDLRMDGSNVIEMKNNIAYSETTSNQDFTSGNYTIRSVTTTVKSGQRVLLIAMASWDHDDNEWVRFKFYRGSTQIGEDMEMEEDDQSGSWVDNSVTTCIWVDTPSAGTHTYYFRADSDDDTTTRIYNSSFVLIKF